ncbi:MAG: ATP-binding protein [Candidatus Hodarchaeales archaeon]
MNQSNSSLHFDYIPENPDKNCIKLLKSSDNDYAIEYSIFPPKTVHICMHAKPKRRFFHSSHQTSLAAIQGYITAMGLHPDFHLVGKDSIKGLLKLIKTQFSLNNERSFISIGLLSTEINSLGSPSNDGCFIDGLLEILTNYPIFAFVQISFSACKTPKEYENKQKNDFPKQILFDIQSGKVNNRSTIFGTKFLEEKGFFNFSIRILVVESEKEHLNSKTDQIRFFLQAHGIKTRIYPSRFRWFLRFKSHILRRSIHPNLLIDGYSLMYFLTLPSKEYANKGYKIVPNKHSYRLSTTTHQELSDDLIRVGIPILSGKTTESPFYLTGKDLSRHMGVFGMTGEGKSRFIFNLIHQFFQKGVKFLIVDPKGEYSLPIQSFCDEFIFIKPGSEDFPWGVNIFHTPVDSKGESLISIEDHIQFVVSLLENSFDKNNEFSPQMRRLIQVAVIKTVRERGNIKTFVELLAKPSSLGLKGIYLENTSAGVINRLNKLLFGNTGRCLSVSETTFDIANFLNHNIIFDLSAFESMEDIKGRQIMLEILFQYLFYFVRKFRKPFKEERLPKNVFILDEINKILPQPSYQSPHPNTIIGKGPWTLRAYDVSMIFIGTDPVLELPMLTNAGVVTMFYSKFDPYKISNLLGTSLNEYLKLQSLLKSKSDERRCLLSVNRNLTLLRTDNFSVNIDQSSSDHLKSIMKNQVYLKEKYESKRIKQF